MKGRKPTLELVAQTADRRGSYPCPAWLPSEARAEWKRAVEDLSSRGLMFSGAIAQLEHYCLSVAQIRQLQAILAKEPLATADGVHPAFTALTKAIQSARLLAVELGLSVVSRARSFQGQKADERDWESVINA
jgi:P27 family predicted phage terminase small subunit